MINRRKFINLGAGLAATSAMVASSNSRTYLRPVSNRKREPPFLLGWYDSITNKDIASQVVPKGIDLLMPYISTVGEAEILAFLNTARKSDAQVLLELYRSLVELEDISGVKKFINTYKKHPSVYGWYLYDEPQSKEPHPLPPGSLKKLYQAIKEEDQSRPVALFISTINKIEYYIDVADILMWDFYPCMENTPEFEWASSYRERLQKVVSLAYDKNKKFLNVIQAYGEGQFGRRLPTKAELRYMFYLSVLVGVDGLLFWTHYRSSNAWNESVLYPTIKEFRRYIPAILKGKDLTNQLQIDKSGIEVKLFSIPHTSKYLVILANHNSSQSNFDVKMNRFMFGQEATAKLSAQIIFNVLLNPYEIRLHELR